MDNRRFTLLLLAVAAMAAIITYLIMKQRKDNDPDAPVNPVDGRVTSPFGPRKAPVAGASSNHTGVDLAAAVGTEVHAPWDGTVAAVWNDQTYGGGLSMKLTHPNGYTTGYCHLSRQLLAKGDTVAQGDVIALTGQTGRASGPHLHFALTDPQGNKIDPQSMFDFKA